jgi:hypothetical protein
MPFSFACLRDGEMRKPERMRAQQGEPRGEVAEISERLARKLSVTDSHHDIPENILTKFYLFNPNIFSFKASASYLYETDMRIIFKPTFFIISLIC